MRIVYLTSCAQDLAWIRQYYATVFPAGKDTAASQFHKVRLALLANPTLGKAVSSGETVRELHIPKTPFSYLYRVQLDRIEMLRIFDVRAENTKGSEM